MLGKNPTRTALGPTRSKVIRRALELYEEETLRMAIEGCAASAWHAGANDRECAYNDVELILRNEAHIERFAEAGESLRQLALRRAARQVAKVAQGGAQEAVPLAPRDEAAERAARAALKILADRMAGRSTDHG